MTIPEQEAKWLPVAQQILDRWSIKHESLKGTIAREIAGIVAEERELCAKIAETAPSECLHMWDRPGGPPGNGWRKTTGADIAVLIRRADQTYTAANGEELPVGSAGTTIINDGRPV